MNKHDWTSFKKRIDIKAAPHIIFDYWTKQGHIEKWFLSKAEFTAAGGNRKSTFSSVAANDTYKWMWHGSDHVAEGKIIESNSTDLVKFTFLGCTVSVQIKEEQGTSIVELIQSEIPLDEDSRMQSYVGCTRGWTFYMANLKSILEGGIDLRNKNLALVDMINT